MEDITPDFLLTEKEKNEYAEKHNGLIYGVVKPFLKNKPYGKSVDFDEYVSIALVGFSKALNTYNKSRHVKFSTYATKCMINEILYYLRKEKNRLENDVSIDAPTPYGKDGEGLSLKDKIPDKKCGASIDLKLLNDEKIEELKKMISTLSEKETYIVVYRFGLNNHEIKTQKKIAEEIGMSQANISKMEKNIAKKMKAIISQNSTYDWMDE